MHTNDFLQSDLNRRLLYRDLFRQYVWSILAQNLGLWDEKKASVELTRR